MELLLVLPFLVVLIFSIVDVGRALNQYLLLTHAVNSGVRYAMGISNLSAESSSGRSSGQVCAPTGAPDTGHSAVQQRVEQLIKLQNGENQSELCITSGLQLNTGDTSDPRTNTVSVRVTTRFGGIFPLFDRLPITVEATAPYLLGAKIEASSTPLP